MQNKPLPALSLLCGAYFHQDWTDDADDIWQPVQEFLSGSSLPSVLQLVSDIDKASHEEPDDDGLFRLLDRLHGSFAQADFPDGAHQWLREVRRRAESEVARRSN